jgi:hypothetical protein
VNDFADIENELKKLRPAQPSPILLERLEEAMAERRRPALSDTTSNFWRRLPRGTAYSWGLAYAAAAVLLVLAIVRMERAHEEPVRIAQRQNSNEATSPLGRSEESPSGRFVPAGATRLVYNTRDEGLQFPKGSDQPLRRVRYHTHETWRWRNPTTGESLRVSYPSEEVVLIPVSGQ